jgi:hypothetical protein
MILGSELRALILIVVIIPVAIFSSEIGDTVTIRYDGFTDSTNWNFGGKARLVQNNLRENVIRLTSSEQVIYGTAFLKKPINFTNPNSDKGSFSSSICFRILDIGGAADNDGVGGDGFAFVIHSDKNSKHKRFGLAYHDIPNSFAIEFDTHQNYEKEDKDDDGNHVAIDTNGNVRSVKSTYVTTRMNNNKLWYAWVNYDGNCKIVDIYLNQNPKRPRVPILKDTIDLFKSVNVKNATAGFTSSTTWGYGKHDIVSMTLSNYYKPEYLKVDIKAKELFARTGEPHKISAVISDNHGNSYNDLVKNVKWRILQDTVFNQGSLTDTTGSETSLIPAIAFTDITIEALLSISNYGIDTLVTDTLKLSIIAGSPYFLSLEKNSVVLSEISTLRYAQPVRELLFKPEENEKNLIAVVRDKSGAFCSYAKYHDIVWSSIDESMIKVISDSSNQSGLIVRRTGRNGITKFKPEMEQLVSFDYAVTLQSQQEFKLSHNENVITVLNEKNNIVTIKYDPGLGNNADSCSFLVTTSNRTVDDTERVVLRKKKFYWEAVIRTTYKPQAFRFNNVIEADYDDTITFTLETTDRSSDSFVTAYPFTISKVLFVRNAAYFDKNSDGYIDMIEIQFNTSDINENIEKIVDLLQFSDYRKVTIDKYRLTGNLLSIYCMEKRNGTPETFVTVRDKIIVHDDILDNGTFVKRGIIIVADSMAPVIVDATIKSCIVDSVYITFSEPVKSIESNFRFWKSNSNNDWRFFDVKELHSDKNIISGVIADHEIEVENNDSLRLDLHVDIVDTNHNIQKIPQKRIVPLINKRGVVVFYNAQCFDMNADGYIDSITIQYDGKLYKKDEAAIAETVQFPQRRNLTIKQLYRYKGEIIIIVDENRNRLPETSISSEDVLSIGNVTFSANGTASAQRLQLQDRMAPVLLSAQILFSVKDTLIAEFTEPVRLYSSLPVIIKHQNRTKYFKAFENHILMRKNILFVLKDELDPSDFKSNDSAFIDIASQLTDLYGNIQGNSENKKVPLQKNIRIIPYHVSLKTVNNPSNGGHIQIVADVASIGKRIPGISGYVTIYNALKKPIKEKEAMRPFLSGRRFIYDWDLSSKHGGRAGAGTYLAVVILEDTDNNRIIKKEYLGIAGK